jgi:hypothetical protein
VNEDGSLSLTLHRRLERGRGERGGNGGGGVAGTNTVRKEPHAHSAGVTDALGRDLGPIPIRRKRIYFIRHGESAW